MKNNKKFVNLIFQNNLMKRLKIYQNAFKINLIDKNIYKNRIIFLTILILKLIKFKIKLF